MPISGALPGNRLVGVAVTPGISSDSVVLTFATSPGLAPAGPAVPQALLEAAQPPFIKGGSGMPIVVAGDRFVRLTLRNMAIANDAGQPFYGGPAEFRAGGAEISDVVQSEAFEGVITWIVGLTRDATCLSLMRSADGMSVTIEASPG